MRKGFLVGDTMPPMGKTVYYFRKERKKPKSTKSDES